MEDVLIELQYDYGSLLAGRTYSINEILEEIEKLQDMLDSVNLKYDNLLCDLSEIMHTYL